nr:MAG TPA: hypothetical protein [Caudoviricetes sp.]
MNLAIHIPPFRSFHMLGSHTSGMTVLQLGSGSVKQNLLILCSFGLNFHCEEKP